MTRVQLQDLELQLQRIIREKFPGVVVRHNNSIPKDGDLPAFDVFFVPDNQSAAFIRYVIDDFSEISERQSLPDLDLISHSAADTELYYPEISRGATTQSIVPVQSSIRSNAVAPPPPQPSHTND